MATISALNESLATEGSNRATAEADVIAAEATIDALSADATAAAGLAGGSLDPVFVDLSVQVDGAGLVAGNQAAIDAANEAIATALAPYEDAGCRAGVVLTFGHAPTIGTGVVLARSVNALLPEISPELFAGAALDSYGNLNQPYGQVDLRIYFFTGCEPTPTS